MLRDRHSPLISPLRTGFAAILLGVVSLAAQAQEATVSPEDLAKVKAAEAARVKVIENIYGTVVAIYGNDRKGGGSGVLYDPDGFALTNHHVVAAAGAEGWAGLADGKLYRWKLIGTDPGGDVAIIHLVGKDRFPVAPLADSETVRVGDWSMAIGNPFVLAEDQRPTVTLGIVSGVHRFQPGEGLNMLVYGNCIQVDSSINPGNSGGPLFSLRGEVIGINGRGSFEERGRVNVGLGYAISSNQVKNFIPDLLATKIAQHGTLDAQFGNRTGGVVCQSLNLNSPAARAGLELGDRLVEFMGQPITGANQFTNVLSTYPAEYPVELTYEREGKRGTLTVRLTALPYDKKAFGAPPRKPGEPAPKKEADEAKGPVEPGKVRLLPVNQEIASILLARMARYAKTLDAMKDRAVRLTQTIKSADDREIGRAEIVAASDGRFSIRVQRDAAVSSAGFDGKTFWRIEGTERTPEATFEKTMRHPFALQAMALTVHLARGVAAPFGKAVLEGSDRSQGQVAYRFAVGPENQSPVYFWCSVFDSQGVPRIRLLKSGVGIHDDEPIASAIYEANDDAHAWFPHITLVKGLAEKPGERIATTKVEPLTELNDELFGMPKP